MLYALILLGIAMNALEITNPFVKKREIPSVYDSLLRVNNIDCSLYSYLKGKRHSKNTYGYF